MPGFSYVKTPFCFIEDMSRRGPCLQIYPPKFNQSRKLTYKVLHLIFYILWHVVVNYKNYKKRRLIRFYFLSSESAELECTNWNRARRQGHIISWISELIF